MTGTGTTSSSPPSSGDAPAPERPRRRISLWGLFSALVFLAGLCSVFSLAGRWFWALDVMTHFRVQYVWLFLIGGAVLAVGRRWRWVAGCGVLALLNLALIAPIWTSGPGRTPPASGQTVCKALSLNVFSSNRTPGKVLDLIAAEQPDVILLMEVNAAWAARLTALNETYPYHLIEDEEDNFGIAFYSKLPLVDGKVEHFGMVRVPSVVARLRLDGRELTVIGTHPLPPAGRFYTQLRNEQLDRLAERAGQVDGPLLVLGDLNCTSWSPAFRDLLARTGLGDTRDGIGVEASWPTFMPFLRVPIDHALASRQVQVVDRRLGPIVGSDHFPVFLTFCLAGETSQ